MTDSVTYRSSAVSAWPFARTVKIYARETKYEFLKLLRTKQFSLATIGFPVMFYTLFGLSNHKMVYGNFIFHPKTYLILSPEYRRIWTWPIDGVANTANIFTLSAGYQF